LQGSVATDLRY